ncbi:hypothetical protein RF11_05938 [Thelohanellus kitauei]|uniref:Uncharacterized protein n=1 Tax=Thelohanellus kitauei TaxID=669202 RepID=A0A0C2JRL4_THEKT|nr:hypothetical protein RF11_05938 [Thelohanellus kitauei]
MSITIFLYAKNASSLSLSYSDFDTCKPSSFVSIYVYYDNASKLLKIFIPFLSESNFDCILAQRSSRQCRGNSRIIQKQSKIFNTRKTKLTLYCRWSRTVIQKLTILNQLDKINYTERSLTKAIQVQHLDNRLHGNAQSLKNWRNGVERGVSAKDAIEKATSTSFLNFITTINIILKNIFVSSFFPQCNEANVIEWVHDKRSVPAAVYIPAVVRNFPMYRKDACFTAVSVQDIKAFGSIRVYFVLNNM